jgi:glutathione S-transferase
MPSLQLYVSALCPFSQRVRLALAEKAVAAEEIEIDLRDKPAGFLKLSPHGKVPLLVHDGRAGSESAVINDTSRKSFPVSRSCPRPCAQSAGAGLGRFRR